MVGAGGHGVRARAQPRTLSRSPKASPTTNSAPLATTTAASLSPCAALRECLACSIPTECLPHNAPVLLFTATTPLTPHASPSQLPGTRTPSAARRSVPRRACCTWAWACLAGRRAPAGVSAAHGAERCEHGTQLSMVRGKGML